VFVQEFPLQALILIAFFLLLAFPIHEFAHAFAAYRLGDATAKLFGRLTLNPIAHFDRFGGTMLVLSILVAGFPFGFAQTPVNPRNLRGRYGEAIVAAAGPISNLLMAAVAAIPLRILTANPDLDPAWVFGNQVVTLTGILHLIVRLSVLLGLFNLIPVPPLDGGTILLTLVSPRTAWQLRPFLSQYGLFILILLIIPFGSEGSILGRVLGPIADSVYGLLVG
jgi:Zn-dependent protease